MDLNRIADARADAQDTIARALCNFTNILNEELRAGGKVKGIGLSLSTDCLCHKSSNPSWHVDAVSITNVSLDLKLEV